MTISEMAPYMNGDMYTRECKAPSRCTPQMYEKVVELAASSKSFASMISMIEDYRDFMHLEPDIANLFPISEREEMFFCLKNGGYCTDVPAKCIYTFKKLFDQYGSVSIALKALPVNTFKVFFQKNYLNNCTMRDVIKNFIDPDYEPLSAARLRLSHDTYDEVLVLEKDMIALLPKDIASKLSDKDLAGITLGKDGLEIDGLLLRFMGGHYGAINSNYDLRRLV